MPSLSNRFYLVKYVVAPPEVDLDGDHWYAALIFSSQVLSIDDIKMLRNAEGCGDASCSICLVDFGK